MRVFVLALAALGIAVAAQAQDAGMMAAQQAMQAAQIANQQAIQANQQAMTDAQRANDQAVRDAQQASALANADGIPVTARPLFSVKPSVVNAGTTVRIKCSTRHAVIYYTTDGWTPTTQSRRYTGPITVDATTEVQAIAVTAGMHRSPVARAVYTVGQPATAAAAQPVMTGEVLRAGTPLVLVTGAPLNSKTAQVGDRVPLLLDEDIVVNGAVVAPKGSEVEARVTEANHAALAGQPGGLAFEVDSLKVSGTEVTLHGGQTLEGADRYGKARGWMFVPVANIAVLGIRGDEAEIKPGMRLTAQVATDTPLHP